MKKIKTPFRILIGTVLLISGAFFLGPKAKYDDVQPEVSALDIELSQLETFIAASDAKEGPVKAGNESRIYWADSVRQTEYALVYLHGFSAGPMEAEPVHREVAGRYGMNLYVPRLVRHGLKDFDQFAELTPAAYVESAKAALAVGRKLGKKVILMSCSTGGTLGIYLSANHPDIHSHIMYSPNLSLYDPTAKMMTGPWGLQIVKQIVGEYRESDSSDKPDSVQQKIEQYWYNKYPVQALVALQALLDQTMTDEHFEQISHPYFLGYYYMNDTAQDMTVSVEAMLAFNDQTQTPADKKVLIPFPEAGDHVIVSPLTSGAVNEVREATFKFVENTLGISPVK